MNKYFPMLTLVLASTAFVAGVVYLFSLRFAAGDVYPPYSSLRADPLGTMGLAESLAKLPGREVRRDVNPGNKLPEEQNTTYLHLAAEIDEWRWMPAELFNAMEVFATRGGRFVVTLRPVAGPDYGSRTPSPFPITTTNTAGTNAPGPGGGRKAFPKSFRPRSHEPQDAVSLQKRWGVEFAQIKLAPRDQGVHEPAQVVNQTDLPLPPGLDWHSAIVLTNLAPSWHVIYARGKSPVVVERRFGRGSVVIATDSFFVSNEAMWKAREPQLLAWLIGPAAQVVFDEAHLGVTESAGVAVLMRRYRLQGMIGGLFLLAGLFIWKHSFSLVPATTDRAMSQPIAGKDAAAGFVNLLRRNIAGHEILEVCFHEWTRSLQHRSDLRIASVDGAQAVMEAERARPARTRDPVQAYRDISRALKKS